MRVKARTEILELEGALLAAPDDRKNLARLAEAYLRARVFHDQALQVYEAALEDDPSRGDLQQALSVARLARGVQDLVRKQGQPAEGAPASIDENVRLLKSWLETYSQSPDLLKALGDLHILGGWHADAAEYYRAACEMGFQPPARILDTVRRVVESKPVTGAAALYFGRMAVDNGQDDLAMGLLKGALGEPQCAERATGLLCDILERLRARLKPGAERDRIAWEMARLRFERDEIGRAIECLLGLDISRGGDEAFIKQLARRLTEMGDYRQAFEYLSQIPIADETKSLLDAIAAALERQGEHDAAAYVLEFVNEHDPAMQEARQLKELDLKVKTQLSLGDLHRSNARPDRALERYVAALRLGYPKTGEILDRIETVLPENTTETQTRTVAELGAHFEDKGDLESAISFFLRALEIDSGHEESRARLRRMYDHLLSQKSLPATQQLDLARIRILSGDLFALQGQTDRAIDEYEIATRYPRTEYAARRRLARAFLDRGDCSRAFDCFTRMQLSPADLADLYAVMEALEQARLYEQALEAATAIANVDPRYRDIQRRIGALEEKVRRGEGPLFDPRIKDLIGEEAAGRYRYMEKIGSGGMGSVHKVFDIQTNQTAAMKILREGLLGSGRAIDRFFREARIAAALNHPNIVSILDYNLNSDVGQSYIVMEFVNGPSLRDRVEDRLDHGRRLTLKDIAEDLYYCSQLCGALEATHAKGIVHRDIKPDNILIDSNNVVKITDFGIIYIADANLTPTGALVGTPRYMSPEQVRGGRIDGRSDIYSLGIILYELLVGSPPFISGDVSYQQVNVPPTPPIEINPDIPPEVNSLILRCLEKDPARRPSGGLEMKKEIDAILHGPLAPYSERLYASRSQTTSSVTDAEQTLGDDVKP